MKVKSFITTGFDLVMKPMFNTGKVQYNENDEIKWILFPEIEITKPITNKQRLDFFDYQTTTTGIGIGFDTQVVVTKIMRYIHKKL